MVETVYKDITKEAVWSVSSSQNGYGIGNLFDGSKETFWQTDSIIPHQIIGVFPKQTHVSSIAMYVSLADDNYVPLECRIEVGSGPSCMSVLGKFTFEIIDGWNVFPIHKDIAAILISIEKNIKDGRNSRVRMLKCYGGIRTNCIDPSIAFIKPELTRHLTIR